MKKILNAIIPKKTDGTRGLKPAILEKIVLENSDEIRTIHEEIEAVNLSYEKYRRNHKILLAVCGLSVLVNTVIATYILIMVF